MSRTPALFAALGAALIAWGVAIVPAAARTPLSYLSGSGTKAFPVVSLTWGLLILSIAVCVVVAVLVVAGIARRRSDAAMPTGTVPLEASSHGLHWIVIGLGISSVALLGSLIWTVAVLADINGPRTATALTIEITGRQWWWQARYLGKDAALDFTTANEFHIPVGQPVRVRLLSDDVIHSFWVPALTGKTETIPGQTNITWLEADKAGIYRGQCTEYCGEQHAHMAFSVVADEPADFAAWMARQAKPAAVVPGDGAQDFAFHCGACHTVRGTGAHGTKAPDLTHLMSRAMLAAGTLPNTPGNLAGWIADPQDVKPGARMPAQHLAGPELTRILDYLETLQ